MFNFVDKFVRKVCSRVVRFNNGKYGVIKWHFFWGKEYLDLNSRTRDTWWSKEQQVLEYCQSDYIEDAIECRDLYVYGYDIPVKYTGLVEVIKDAELKTEIAEQRLRGIIRNDKQEA